MHAHKTHKWVYQYIKYICTFVYRRAYNSCVFMYAKRMMSVNDRHQQGEYEKNCQFYRDDGYG